MLYILRSRIRTEEGNAYHFVNKVTYWYMRRRWAQKREVSRWSYYYCSAVPIKDFPTVRNLRLSWFLPGMVTEVIYPWVDSDCLLDKSGRDDKAGPCSLRAVNDSSSFFLFVFAYVPLSWRASPPSYSSSKDHSRISYHSSSIRMTGHSQNPKWQNLSLNRQMLCHRFLQRRDRMLHFGGRNDAGPLWKGPTPHRVERRRNCSRHLKS